MQDGQIEIMRMLKHSSNIIIYFNSRRSHVRKISENKKISFHVMTGI